MSLSCDVFTYLRSEAESHTDKDHMTEIANFENSRCERSPVICPYLSRESSDFDEVECADA